MRTLLLLLGVSATAPASLVAAPYAGARARALGARADAASCAARADAPRMVFGLSTPASVAPTEGPEVLYHRGARIDFRWERLGLTRRRVSGGLDVAATPEDIWRVLTAYERLPTIVPNILSNEVTRPPAGSSANVLIDQTSLLSRKLNLKTQIGLEAVEGASNRELTLRRVSGHGFLEFEAIYKLRPQPDGTTYLGYSVDLVPCPIFPLPLVERKIRKEVPGMLVSFRDAAVAGRAAALKAGGAAAMGS